MKFLLQLICLISIVLSNTSASSTNIIQGLLSRDLDVINELMGNLGVKKSDFGLSEVTVSSINTDWNKKFHYFVTISYESPRDGYVILLSNNGEVLYHDKVGRIISSQLTICSKKKEFFFLIDAIEGAGSSYRKDKYVLYSLNSDSIDRVWEGISYESSFPLFFSREDNYIIRGQVQFGDSQKNCSELIYKHERLNYDPNSKGGFDILLNKTQGYEKIILK